MLIFVNKYKVANGNSIIVSKNKPLRMVLYRPPEHPDFGGFKVFVLCRGV